jgi:hypothetical protein
VAETKTETKTGPAPKAATVEDVALTLEDREMALADLIGRTGQTAVAKAWAAGHVEIGRRTRVVTGNPNIKLTRENESPARLVVEDGFEWSGPKTAQHASLAAIAAETLPNCEHYRKYEKRRNDRGEQYHAPVAIDRAEAVALCAYTVRLTDKGLAALAPAA